MVRLIRQAALAAAVVAVSIAPARAQQAPRPGPQPPPATDGLQEQTKKTEEAFRRALEAILRAVESLVQSVPVYEPPEVLENGDIIIRRKRPKPAPKEKKDDKPADTSRT